MDAVYWFALGTICGWAITMYSVFLKDRLDSNRADQIIERMHAIITKSKPAEVSK